MVLHPPASPDLSEEKMKKSSKQLQLFDPDVDVQRGSHSRERTALSAEEREFIREGSKTYGTLPTEDGVGERGDELDS